MSAARPSVASLAGATSDGVAERTGWPGCNGATPVAAIGNVAAAVDPPDATRGSESDDTVPVPLASPPEISSSGSRRVSKPA